MAILALRHDGIGYAFLLCFSILGLIYYPLSDWAWSDTGWSASRVHLFQALFLTVPFHSRRQGTTAIYDRISGSSRV